ncbi:MAG TPA: hypothetical protein V6C81_01035 [Planktothrix sp.]|jgi:hypothetical protein
MTDETVNPSKPSRMAIWGSFAGLLIAWLSILCVFPRVIYKESDIYWMLEVGRNILRQHGLPSVDTFSYNTLATPWVVYQWLTELIFTTAAFAGMHAVTCVGQVTLALLLCVLVYRRAIKLGANSIVSFVVVAIATYCTFPDIGTLRPQLFSFVFVFALQCIFEDAWSTQADKRQSTIMLVKTAVVAVLWANCHISFPMGFALAGVYLCCQFVRAIRYKGYDKDLEQKRLSLFGRLSAVFAIGTLINPYGVGLWLFLETISKLHVTPEMMPLTDVNHLLMFSALLITALSAWKKAGVPRLIWLSALFVAGILHTRFTLYFAICVIPLVAQAISDLLPNLTSLKPVAAVSEAVKEAAMKKVYPIAVTLLAAIIVCCQPLYIPVDVPLVAAESLQKYQLRGNLFASIHANNYLIYRYDGSLKVFVDTRFDRYDPALVKSYFDALQGDHWKELFSHYNITEALLPYGLPITALVAKDPDWVKVYEDPYFSIFIRK